MEQVGRQGLGSTNADASGHSAEIELRKSGYTTLVSCKRWKVAQTGIVPLRELHEAMQARGARDCIYVTAGGFTEMALAFAQEKKVRLLHGTELARCVAPLLSRKDRDAVRA